MFQAAGIAIALFVGRLERSAARIRRLGFLSAIAGLLFVATHYLLEPARMAGSFAGVLDMSLQQLVFESPLSRAAGLRLVGLALICATMFRNGRGAAVVGLLGTLAVTFAFTVVGHTADESRTPWLAVLLVFHLLVAAFWFGGLPPLYLSSRLESPARAAQIVADFTRFATYLVPGLFLAGALMALLLVDRWEIFREGYGLLLIAKAAGFAVLMALASLNKWRYGPAIAAEGAGVKAFQRTVAIEYALICLVLIATAFMTTFFSPSR